MDKTARLMAIIEEEEKARREAYKGYCAEYADECGDHATPMTYEEWEKDFEECGGWEGYFC